MLDYQYSILIILQMIYCIFQHAQTSKYYFRCLYNCVFKKRQLFERVIMCLGHSNYNFLLFFFIKTW